ncbi:hypothetical protein ACW5XI_07415 [Aeromonas australiensis]
MWREIETQPFAGAGARPFALNLKVWREIETQPFAGAGARPFALKVWREIETQPFVVMVRLVANPSARRFKTSRYESGEED